MYEVKTPIRCRLMIRLGLWDIGRRLHPGSVTSAWYAADCPDKFDARQHGISFQDRLRWRVSRVLRGV